MNSESSKPASIITIQALIERARRDPRALGELLDRYRPFLRMTAQIQLNPKTAGRIDASDVAQETLAEVVRRFDRFEGATEPEFTAWLRRIHQHTLDNAARRHILAQKRAVGRENPFFAADGSASFLWHEHADGSSTPSRTLIKGDNALRLAEILLALPERQAEAVRLRYLEASKVAEIAQRLETTVEAAAGLIRRGLASLRDRMHEESWL